MCLMVFGMICSWKERCRVVGRRSESSRSDSKELEAFVVGIFVDRIPSFEMGHWGRLIMSIVTQNIVKSHNS